MSSVFSRFRFRSPKLVRNPSPRAVLATSGAKKVAVDFFQSNDPIHPVSPKTHVWCVFAVSVSVNHTRAKLEPEGRSGDLWSKKIAVHSFKSNAPNPPRSTQYSCLVCFRSFGFGLQNWCETRPSGPFWLHEERKKLQLIFSNRTHPIHPVRLKTHVWCVFAVSVWVTK